MGKKQALFSLTAQIEKNLPSICVVFFIKI